MRKISILSLIAVLSATPMMAKADMTRATKVGIDSQTQQFVKNTNVASTSYVQGAYNALVDEINTDRGAIDAVNSNITVATKAEGEYVAIHTDSSVGQNLAALDDKVAAVESAASNALSDAVDALTNSVSASDSGITITVAQQSGMLSSVSASINDSAVTTDKIADKNVTASKIADDTITAGQIATSAVTTDEIADGTILVEDMNASAVVTAAEGIADSTTATDDRLVTEAAVRSAIDTINSAADSLDSKVGDLDDLTGDAEDASTIVAAINAVDDAMNNKRLTVYTEWNQDTRQEIALSAATSAAQPGGGE